MTVITLSRQLGSHGDEIAFAVAQRLGLRLVDAGCISQAAQQAGVPEVALVELEREGVRGLADQVLSALRTMPSLSGMAPSGGTLEDEASRADAEVARWAIPFSGLFSPTVPPISASIDSYLRVVNMVIRGVARQGQVLILGRGGQVVLHKHPSALHVLVLSPTAYRVEQIMVRSKLTKRAAQDRLRASDRARADYLRRYHNADWLDPTLYHLVINGGWLPVDTAVELIIAAQKAIEPAGERQPA